MLNKVLTRLAVVGFAFVLLAMMSSTVYAATRGVVVGEVVNVRAYGYINETNRLFQVGRGQIVDIHDVSGDFFRVNVQGETDVYIAREWIRVSETMGTVTNASAWIYNKPVEYGGHPIASANMGEMLTVTSAIDGWYGINFSGNTAFIQQFNVNTPFFVDLPIARVGGSGRLADEIIDLAKRYIGTRHVLGGNGPNGFDCSGFMTYILAPFDISVSRHSGDMAREGEHVDRHALERGDLVFFSATGGGRISHVGMYIGGGDFIHSSWGTTGVIIDSMSDPYYTRNFVTARRIF